MASVGVRELRQAASELLRRVEQGETIEITDRGRPVALLSPLPDGGPLERLRAGGQVDEATGSLDDLPDPLVMPAGSESASAALARLREFER
jgi:prevent-host-death family protein